MLYTSQGKINETLVGPNIMTTSQDVSQNLIPGRSNDVIDDVTGHQELASSDVRQAPASPEAKPGEPTVELGQSVVASPLREEDNQVLSIELQLVFFYGQLKFFLIICDLFFQVLQYPH